MTEETNDNESPEENDELAKIHQDARIEFNNIHAVAKDERKQARDDRRFYSIAGAQWEGPLQDQFENKPRFEVNKIHLSVIRIISEWRNNRITVDFLSKEGNENDTLADTCDGLYRADEEDSCAEEAYDNAFEEGVGGGYGAWRLRTEYEDEDDDEDERQRIRMEPIFDADTSVFFDLNAKRQDKSDARHCYVLTAMTRGSYEEEYDDDVTSWPKTTDEHTFDWATPDVVYIAEFYRKETTKDTVYIYETLDGKEERYTDADFEEDEMLLETLIATGSREIRQKKVNRQRIRKFLMSGSKILEDCGYIAGKMIPIVPFYGKRWYVDNIERAMGHVRLAKDPQRLKNMQLSKLGEISALSPVEKPILTPEQVAGHTEMWAEDNIKDYPYLLVNPVTDVAGNQTIAGPIGYTKPPAIPPALAALLQITETDIQDVLGNPQAGEKIVSNISEETVGLIQEQLGMQTFIYMSNFAKSMRRSGEIWQSMAKDVLVEPGRKMKTVGLQKEIGTIEIAKPKINEDSGKMEYENDISSSKFDVTVSVGPSSSSRKAATVRSLMNMMKVATDPETLQVLSAMIMMNMEGEGIQDARDFFRQKLIRLGAVKPTEEEQQQLMAELQNQQPDPQSQYLTAAAEEAQAQAVKAQASTVKTLADAEKSKAETVETLAGIDRDDQEAAIKTAQAMADVIEKGQMSSRPAETEGL